MQEDKPNFTIEYEADDPSNDGSYSEEDKEEIKKAISTACRIIFVPLTNAEKAILMAFMDNRKLTIEQLARKLKLKKSDVSMICSKLEKDGFLSIRDCHDGKKRLAVINNDRITNGTEAAFKRLLEDELEDTGNDEIRRSLEILSIPDPGISQLGHVREERWLSTYLGRKKLVSPLETGYSGAIKLKLPHNQASLDITRYKMIRKLFKDSYKEYVEAKSVKVYWSRIRNAVLMDVYDRDDFYTSCYSKLSKQVAETNLIKKSLSPQFSVHYPKDYEQKLEKIFYDGESLTHFPDFYHYLTILVTDCNERIMKDLPDIITLLDKTGIKFSEKGPRVLLASGMEHNFIPDFRQIIKKLEGKDNLPYIMEAISRMEHFTALIDKVDKCVASRSKELMGVVMPQLNGERKKPQTGKPKETGTAQRKGTIVKVREADAPPIFFVLWSLLRYYW